MWTLTNFGAFSTTLRDVKSVPRGDDRLLQVRARRAKHLLELKNRYMPMVGEIVRKPDRDYEFRFYCTHDDWALAVARMAQDINYGNFKNSVKDRDLHDAYIRVWSALYNALATNKISLKRKPRRGKKLTREPIQTNIWEGWEDVDYDPSHDRRSALDEFPELQWR
jgi:hypothetical protein